MFMKFVGSELQLDLSTRIWTLGTFPSAADVLLMDNTARDLDPRLLWFPVALANFEKQGKRARC